MNELIEGDKKALTEFLGECWHEWQDIRGSVKQELFACLKCGEVCKGIVSIAQKQRTFTTWEDLGALKEKLVETGKWNDFDEWAYMKWDSLKPFNDLSRRLEEQSDWLFTLNRFCWLVSEFLRKEQQCAETWTQPGHQHIHVRSHQHRPVERRE